MPTLPPPNESKEDRIMRKANDIRAALIAYGLSISPDSNLTLAELPTWRQEKWIKIAKTYVEVM